MPDPGAGPVREILVVELLGGFGDLLMALPAVHALARSHPAAAVRVLTFAPGDQLLAADPHVASVTALQHHRDGAARAAVETALAQRDYDLAVSTTRYDGIGPLLEARVPRAVTDLWRGPPAGELVERRFLALLHAEGLVADADLELPLQVALTAPERERAARLVGPGLGAPLLVLPDAGMAVKRWPAGRWRALAARAGRPVLTVDQGADVLAGIPGVRVLPPLGLRELAAVAAEVGARGGSAVGGDTGPVRLATAVGCPAVGLYGPTTAARYGLSERRSLSLQGLPGCPVRRPTSITEQECWWTARCPLSSHDPACMVDVGTDAVLAALAAVAAVAA